MISLMAAAYIYAAAFQSAAADSARKAFTACLRESVSAAKNEKVAVDGFDAFVRARCSGQGDGLKNAMIAFDLRNKVSRKQATADADVQLGDYFTETAERYKYEVEAGAPR